MKLVLFFLKSYNNLSSNLLNIGQTLLIPKTSDYQTYIVVSGDSLYKIANKFNEVCFNEFKNNFKALDINDISEFKSSKFSLNFTVEQRIELDRKVYEYYNSYCETINEITKKFVEYVKDLK